MSFPSFVSRIPRPVAAGGAALALVAAGVLAPQTAFAYHFVQTPPYSACVDASLPTLVAGGQAVKKKSGLQGPGFYAKGSGDFLGNTPSNSAALGEVSPGVWKKVPVCQ